MFKLILKHYGDDAHAKQMLTLFSVNIIGIPVSVVISIIVTKYLGVQGYGDYVFINSIFNFAIIIFNFGFFQAGNRALVLNNDKRIAKEYYGAELVITGILFILMSISLGIYALFDHNIHTKNLDNLLLCLIPFGWIFLLLRYFETLFLADNRIRLLSVIRLYPKVFYLLTIGLVCFLLKDWGGNKQIIIWTSFLLTQFVVYLFVFHKLRFSFCNIKRRLLEIWIYNKQFGFNVYIGSLFAVGLANLSAIIISYFGTDNRGVGFYSLALAFSTPLSIIPSTIATTHYKDFSKMNVIPKKLTLYTFTFSVATLIFLCLIISPFINFFYGDAFKEVVNLTIIVCFGMLFYGMADYINRFLGAHGEGKLLRNSALFVGVTLLIANISLIPPLGERGAAICQLVSGSVYLVNMAFYYKSFTNKRLTIK